MKFCILPSHSHDRCSRLAFPSRAFINWLWLNHRHHANTAESTLGEGNVSSESVFALSQHLTTHKCRHILARVLANCTGQRDCALVLGNTSGLVRECPHQRGIC